MIKSGNENDKIDATIVHELKSIEYLNWCHVGCIIWFIDKADYLGVADVFVQVEKYTQMCYCPRWILQKDVTKLL